MMIFVAKLIFISIRKKESIIKPVILRPNFGKLTKIYLLLVVSIYNIKSLNLLILRYIIQEALYCVNSLYSSIYLKLLLEL
jgi:hypothetical protein